MYESAGYWRPVSRSLKPDAWYIICHCGFLLPSTEWLLALNSTPSVCLKEEWCNGYLEEETLIDKKMSKDGRWIKCRAWIAEQAVVGRSWNFQRLPFCHYKFVRSRFTKPGKWNIWWLVVQRQHVQQSALSRKDSNRKCPQRVAAFTWTRSSRQI